MFPFLIAVEGIQGAGKSTAQDIVLAAVEAQGAQALVVPWNSDPFVSPTIQSLKRANAYTPLLWTLLHAADFAANYEKRIVPALTAGKTVICDRYIYTAFCRDVPRGVTEDYVRCLYRFAKEPDLIIYIAVDVETAFRRKAAALYNAYDTTNMYHNAGMDVTGLPLEASFKKYNAALLETYRRILAEIGNVAVIDGRAPSSCVSHQVRAAVNALFASKGAGRNVSATNGRSAGSSGPSEV